MPLIFVLLLLSLFYTVVWRFAEKEKEDIFFHFFPLNNYHLVIRKTMKERKKLAKYWSFKPSLDTCQAWLWASSLISCAGSALWPCDLCCPTEPQDRFNSLLLHLHLEILNFIFEFDFVNPVGQKNISLTQEISAPCVPPAFLGDYLHTVLTTFQEHRIPVWGPQQSQSRSVRSTAE